MELRRAAVGGAVAVDGATDGRARGRRGRHGRAGGRREGRGAGAGAGGGGGGGGRRLLLLFLLVAAGAAPDVQQGPPGADAGVLAPAPGGQAHLQGDTPLPAEEEPEVLARRLRCFPPPDLENE